MLVRVLGGIGAEHADGRLIAPPSGPQRRLLALLAMRAGRAVTSDTICDLFDLSPGAVRTSVSRLRKLLGTEVVVTAAGAYTLVADTDADRFQRAVTTARSLPSDEAVPFLIDALAAFAGPPLDEFASEPWAIAEVTRLVELRGAVVEDLATLHIDAGRFDDAVDLLHSHIEDFPYRDRPRELLLRALAASGRQVEALRHYQQYRSLLGEEVGVEPGDAIRELESTIAAGGFETASAVEQSVARPSSAGADHLTNLAEAPNRFIGRVEDQAALAAALGESRLVTLLGPGGVGKTRLAHRVASDRVGLHRDGVWIAELVDSETETEIVRVIADAVGAAAGDAAALAAQLAGRDALLIVDNCEHAIDAIAEVIDALLASSRRLRIIATSRTPLRLPDERVVTLGPLTPDAAVELYEHRAEAAGVRIAAQDRVVIADICAQLDGVPLAVELAAASSRVLTPTDLRAQLHRRFEVLKGRARGRLAGRHDSLRAAVESSFEALSDDAQTFFALLAAFAGEFPLSAVEAAAEGLDTHAFDLVAELIDMSMLTTSRRMSGTQYRMLETLRHYGLERLQVDGRLSEAEDRQIEWIESHAAAQVAAAFGASESLSVDSMVGAAPNLRLAVVRLLERGDRDRAVALVLSIEDLAYASNRLAAVVEPLVSEHDFDTPNTNQAIKRVWSIELIRRSTSGSTESRVEVAAPLAPALSFDDPGPVLAPALLITTALGHGPGAELLDRVVERARSESDVAERARLFVGAGLARYYGDHLPDDFGPVDEALHACERAGMRRLTIAVGSMACIGGLRLDRPLEGARLAQPVLAHLDDLPHPSIMSNGLVTLYTEAAIRADLAPDEHLLGVERTGAVLQGDFNRLGLGLARIVQHHGHHALAVRAVGACEITNRSRFSAGQVETILELAGREFEAREIDALLAAGAVSEQSDLYREMWGLLEPSMPSRVRPGTVPLSTLPG